MKLYEDHKEMLGIYNIDTALRLRHFFTQGHAESNLIPIAESLYYKSIKSLRATFRTPFLGKPDSFVSQYLFNSEKCANYVYANRGGNGNEASGDGYRLRGRGFFQHTGFDQLYTMSWDLGIDFLENPDLLLQEYYAMLGACWYWNENKLYKYADKNNLDAVSDIVNIGKLTKTYGDSNGFEHRLKWLKHYEKVFA